MAAYIFADNEYKLLAGNKIVHNGNMLSMKDTDKIIIDGKAYYLGDYVDPITDFPDLYKGDGGDWDYYVLGDYIYCRWKRSSSIMRYMNNYKLSKLSSEAGISKDGFIIHVDAYGSSKVGKPENDNIVDFTHQWVSHKTDSYNETSNGSAMSKYTAYSSSVGFFLSEKNYIYNAEAELADSKKMLQHVHLIEREQYYRTELEEPRYTEETHDIYISAEPDTMGFLYVDNTQAVADKTFKFLSKNGRFAISSDGNLYTRRSQTFVLYDNSGYWTWCNGMTYDIGVKYRRHDANGVMTHNESIYHYGYGIRAGMLMYFGASYPTVLDNRTTWTHVSDTIPLSDYDAGNESRSFTAIYGICEGNLYKILGDVVTLVSDTGDWIKTWGSSETLDIPSSNIREIAYAARNDGRLYSISNETITDLGSVSGGIYD